ncbi:MULTISPECIES: O-methyltransferase [Leeia]|uniref:SAM-dependent methyltransferase n=1 Tax=Leeia aquatica TaxID=2725557 RepID=A0A847SHC6_9NEIS|nr:class I SAM-dependent methyltransferase [Leeia aquatica]NLR76776.1 SAM-dependent methyltransferase [Leeia aquatica]
MSQKTIQLTEPLYQYLLSHSLAEHPLQKQLREETDDLPMARMATAPEQGQFLGVLIKALRVKRYLEIGTFTGYSSLSVGLHLPEDGEMVALERKQEWAEMAQVYWERAGFASRVDLRVGNALDSLQDLLAEGKAGWFDLAFIDADKPHYNDYFEACLQLVRPQGLIIIDNVLWHGNVIKADHTDADTEEMRAFNRRVHQDPRVEITMLPLGDGMTLAYKQ